MSHSNLTPDELKAKAQRFQTFLETRHGQEPEQLLERMELLAILVAQSGQCLAEAKYHQDQVVNGAIGEAIDRAFNDKLSASTINQYVKSTAKDYNYLVNWLDRINATATHQLDALRTIISYRKTEFNALNYGT
jgi:hypothetical protein